MVSFFPSFFRPAGSGAPVTVYLHIVSLLTAVTQPKYFYGVAHGTQR